LFHGFVGWLGFVDVVGGVCIIQSLKQMKEKTSTRTNKQTNGRTDERTRDHKLNEHTNKRLTKFKGTN
jgi:hypothetical protein